MTATGEVRRKAITFGRVLVGVDPSGESREAARQAAILAEPGGSVTLLAAYDVAPGIVGGTGTRTPPYFDEDLQRQHAEDALARTREAVAGLAAPAGKVARGNAREELLREIQSEGHTLVAVGSHGVGRIRGILIGSTATQLVHRAPCSVLVARKAGERFPKRIAVGVDGSPDSAAAYATARRLAERFSAELTAVVARGGGGVDERSVAAIVGESAREVPEGPVEALVAVGEDADLLVVGSRGRTGLRALGSTSERVAHQASCSVLVVRRQNGHHVSS
jgi:nucleotide-binding universal stress UspA family protein